MSETAESGQAPSRSRRRPVALTRGQVLAAGLVIVVATGGAGWAAGSRIASPAELAARAQPPEASLVTVPVERRVLSADIVTRCDVGYSDPVRLVPAGPLGSETARQVATRLPDEGATLTEGDVAAEVAGRPVLLLQGPVTAYRDLRPGATGADVAQLEEALVRLGHLAAGDDRWDGETGAALGRLYAAVGHTPRAADADGEQALAAARAQVRDAERAVRDVTAAPAAAPRSEVLRARSGLESTREALAAAEDQHRRAVTAARRAVDAARAQVAAAERGVALAQAQYDAAVAAATAGAAAADRETTSPAAVPAAWPTGDVAAPEVTCSALAQPVAEPLAAPVAQPVAEPDSAEPPSPVDIAVLDAARADARDQLAAARQGLADAEAAVADADREGAVAVVAARREVTIAEAALAEFEDPPADPAAARAREDARAALEQANDDLAALVVSTGTWLPAGEVAYVPAVPVQVASRDVEPGAEVSDALLTVAGATTSMKVTLGAGDSTRVQVGDEVRVEEPDLPAPLTGTVSEVPGRSSSAAPDTAADAAGGAASGDGDTGDSADTPGGGGSRRVTIEVALPDVPDALIDRNVRVVIPVESTQGEVLVVPAAALSARADGTTAVQVEDAAAPDGSRFVTVRTGLASNGAVEVAALDGGLDEGDRVVVGAQGGADDGTGGGTDGGTASEASRDE